MATDLHELTDIERIARFRDRRDIVIPMDYLAALL